MTNDGSAKVVLRITPGTLNADRHSTSNGDHALRYSSTVWGIPLFSGGVHPNRGMIAEAAS